MNSPVLDAMLGSPLLPELILEGQRVMARETRIRRKFYEDITPEHKWEFIQGEVIMHSPALHRHLLGTKLLFRLMDNFVAARQLGLAHTEKAMVCFPRNDYEPDIVFFGPSKTATLDPDTLRFPIPDLIVEVLSPSTKDRDRGVKFQDYAFHGVAEYWIVDPDAETVELYRLAGDVYPAVEAQSTGLLVSEVIPGLEVPVRAVFDEEENHAALKRLLGA